LSSWMLEFVPAWEGASAMVMSRVLEVVLVSAFVFVSDWGMRDSSLKLGVVNKNFQKICIVTSFYCVQFSLVPQEFESSGRFHKSTY
jgi:hypothetical protein